MATASPQRDDIPADDELDAILNGTLDIDELFNIDNTETEVPSSRPLKPPGDDGGLGIDEEIKVVKKRHPIPKLDDNRLLSDPGIPKLRRISKDRLKFKGKGHEYGDIARMLNMYQLWLDDLYPRAKFADALAIIEKLGHTKRVQMLRKEWIDEGKPRHTTREEDEADVIVTDSPVQPDADQMEGVEEETIRIVEQNPPHNQTDGTNNASTTLEDPDDDELDLLLAGSTAPAPPTRGANPTTTAIDEDPFADAMEAMADMDDVW
ncbi:Swi3-domain-containing protein [Bimuria novae-zelandiae CBS 107.79]|uniref:Chromosome segregation in meiosis protein n=1 Tax=Bimuria novae-zelandiae CBS 107.79 TaxID=1447943 RepID=A0A6A5VMF1_9PLEO|nr:Swi3-domain-containing protein [Bimuria novae-zelandiae CBS 107.79]